MTRAWEFHMKASHDSERSPSKPPCSDFQYETHWSTGTGPSGVTPLVKKCIAKSGSTCVVCVLRAAWIRVGVIGSRMPF